MAVPRRKSPDDASAGSVGRRGLGPSREQDPHGWALRQAELLRAGRVEAIDAKGIAEELRAMARREYFALQSALRVLLLHLLKWDAQPSLRSKSWVFSVREQRRRVEEQLGDNPGLRPRLAEAIKKFYNHARGEAMRETNLSDEHFPLACPYSFQEMMEKPIPLEVAKRWS